MTATAEPRLRWLAPIALACAIGLLAALVGGAPIASPDYGWHLETGELIAETGSVPTTDPYTFTVPGARWIDTHWLFQLALHGLYELGGHQAVRLGKAACVLALVAVLGSIGWRRRRSALSALALGAMITAPLHRLIERPELVSFLFLAILLALLDRHDRRGGLSVFAIVPVQLLWANVHGLFALGVAVCAMALAAELLRSRVYRESLRREKVRNLALVTLLSALVSFANPNGIDAVRLPFEQLGMIGLAGDRRALGQTILELRPITSVPGGVGIFAWAGGLALVALALNWRHVRIFDALLFVSFSLLTFGAVRNVALLAIASVPIAVRNLNDFIDRHPLPRGGPAVAALVALAALSAAIARQVEHQGSIWTASPLQEGAFSEAAADWILRERPNGPIYHAMGDGGYLIWRLHPDYPVMVDGRLEVFGPSRFEPLSLRTSGSPRGFLRLDREYHFGVALISHRFFPVLRLLRWLNRSPEWRLVQLDEMAAVFVRAGESPPAWPELGAGDADLLTPLGDPDDTQHDLWRRAMRVTLLRALDRPDRAAGLTRKTCAHYADASMAGLRCQDPTPTP